MAVKRGGLHVFGMDQHQAQSGEVGYFECLEKEVLQQRCREALALVVAVYG